MPGPDRPLRVFLCHSSHDKPVVRDLYRRLDAEGWIDPWLDEVKLYPGQDWNFEIEQAVEEADVILVCITNNSVTKEGYIQRELRMVLDFSDYKPEGTLFVIPIRLEECETPRRLRKWQYADFFPESDRDHAFQRLLVSLRMRAKKLNISTENPAEEKARREEAERKQRQTELQEQARLAEEKRKSREAEERKRKLNQEKLHRQKEEPKQKAAEFPSPTRRGTRSTPKTKRADLKSPNSRVYGIGAAIIFIIALWIFGRNSMIQNEDTLTPTEDGPFVTSTPSQTQLAPAMTSIPNTPTDIAIPVSPMPALAVGSTTISEMDGMTLLYVPAGEFTMGSNDGADDEKPTHAVYVDAFWIDQTEITNNMFAEYLNANGLKSFGSPFSENDTQIHFEGINWNTDANYDYHPVIDISWNDATAYCKWANRRLPTEAEWEKAARGGLDGNMYPWGNETPVCEFGKENGAQFAGCGGGTISVGSFSENGYGLFDMAGNAWEWTLDAYLDSYYSISPYSNPPGPDNLQGNRVRRGGAWDTGASSISTSSRWGGAIYAYDFVGFRCAMDAE